ncbi:efflux RND transporter periplasmic adaptor subunit [Pseudomaricurvus sp. HS19]|uniref:efflux RND transporter periplasmic adaptor subunit n=1 Tax=Pseudomaricurvus sp. HS19 TaxID=2692626 RepID=UPI00136B7BCD|nr:efflux RND transporter periplasmic adaptor subunit [Pseudomaricurvus sp. HS19]MYM62097.1 efflux RND transporter periplasmic adaptor subunit [Pseudomaricurvus sp. HS19]
MKRTLWILVALALLLAAFFWWRHAYPAATAAAVIEAKTDSIAATVTNTRAGTIKACRRSKLALPIGGVVNRLLVDEGDEVQPDQLLLELWNLDRAADVQQAEQTLKAAKHDQTRACETAELKQRELKRINQLAKRNLASEEARDSAEIAATNQKLQCEAAADQVGVARARLDYQQAIFERTQLRAPFAGTVAEINGELGEYITPSPPGIPTPAAVDLIDTSCLYVTAPIDEVDAASLHTGLPVTITLDAYPEQPLPGTLSRIAPYVQDYEKQARTVDVDVQLNAGQALPHLLVGYSADVTVILEQREQRLVIPLESITTDGSVWRLDSDNRLQRVAITTGLRNWSHAEVLSGIKAGDRLLAHARGDWQEGQLIHSSDKTP